MPVIVSGKTFDGKVASYYMDPALTRALDVAKKRVTKRNWDYVAVVSGIPGCHGEVVTIKTSEGILPIGDLPTTKPIIVKAMDFERKEIVDAEAYVVPSGDKELFEIETEDGRTIEASADHKFFIMRNRKVEEIELKNLKQGDKLICE